ncbi:hypothetical protein [Bifidobacterium phasiani]|uniref:Uncharacterized protein n=1 Tax=Bifidobacterium phasiani TaxID=2834431 RepID=A0ABS6W8U2_9BIFI|nr:hypothetical protein [Bifidobacterium phasiani]MBW3082857.1 hypothetical protein [Bifidobacterium phasiani]
MRPATPSSRFRDVTVPARLGTWADKHDVNYSGVLRDVLEHLYRQPAAV